MSNFTPEQLEARRRGIGGSEISAVLGMDPFKGPLDVYLSKAEGYEQPDNPDMERGRFLEEGIARWYAHREQVRVVRELPTVFGSLPNAFCTPDGFVELPSRLRRDVSIKAPRFGLDWGETGGQHVPLHYVLQLQWEDAILSTVDTWDPVAHLVAFVEGDLRVYPITRDRELQGWMLDEARRWWVDHIEAKKPPPLDGSAGAAAWLRRRFPRDTKPVRAATLDEQTLLFELQARQAEVDAAEKAYATARQRVEEAIADGAGIEGAVGRVTWRADKNGKRSFRPRWTSKGELT